MSKAKNKLWSVTRIVDPAYPGFTVRVGEVTPGGVLHIFRWKDGKQVSATLGLRRRDLGATPRMQVEVARAKGRAVIAQLAKGGSLAPGQVAREDESIEHLALGTLIDLYEERWFQDTQPSYKRDQVAKLRRFASVVGADRLVCSLCETDVKAFTARRKTDGVRQGTLAGDLHAVKLMLNWAHRKERRRDGRPLLADNPLSEIKVNGEGEPLLPVADDARYSALRSTADHQVETLRETERAARAEALRLTDEQAQATVRRDADRADATRRTWEAFRLGLDLAWETGRRIGAILGLRWGDVSFETSDVAPDGTITWYAEHWTTNKVYEETVQMSKFARKVLLAERSLRPGMPAAYIFPAARTPGAPVRTDVAKQWMERAEKVAGLPHLKGGLWHPFRRGFITLRADYPEADTMRLVGHRDNQTHRRYRRPQVKTLLAALNRQPLAAANG